MKKNKILRLASVMLMLCLITTCAISGTFAKYTTSGSGSETARVAKWGVTFATVPGDLSTSYATTDTDHSADITTSVKADADVVAPGTSGKLFGFQTSGSPEVAFITTFSLDETATTLIFTNKKVVGNAAETITDGYYPVVFTVKLNDNVISSDANTEAELKTALEKCQYRYDVGTGKYWTSVDGGTNWVEGTTTVPQVSVSWNWAFEGGAIDDAADTTIGNLMAGDSTTTGLITSSSDYSTSMTIVITATATQID